MNVIKVDILDNFARSEVEIVFDYFEQFLLGLGRRTIGENGDGQRMRNAD